MIVLNKQLRTTSRGWTSMLEVGQESESCSVETSMLCSATGKDLRGRKEA